MVCVPPPPPPVFDCLSVSASSLSGPILASGARLSGGVVGRSTGKTRDGDTAISIYVVNVLRDRSRGVVDSSMIYANATCYNGSLIVSWAVETGMSNGGGEFFRVPVAQ